MYYLSYPFGVCRKLAPHLWHFFGMPSRTCQPRLARQFGQRFVNWSRHNTRAAPNSVPIKLSWVRLEISKNSITPIATNTKSQKAINNPIVALWCWRNFFRSLADIRFSLELSHAPLSAVSWGCGATQIDYKSNTMLIGNSYILHPKLNTKHSVRRYYAVDAFFTVTQLGSG